MYLTDLAAQFTKSNGKVYIAIDSGIVIYDLSELKEINFLEHLFEVIRSEQWTSEGRIWRDDNKTIAQLEFYDNKVFTITESHLFIYWIFIIQ